jgi:Arc/MetJ-type ribon-helix-helix transcriptional regulator
MTTMTIELTEDMKEFVDRRVAAGAFKDGAAVIQALFHVALAAERRDAIDQKLMNAIDEIESGECAPWEPGDAHKLLH